MKKVLWIFACILALCASGCGSNTPAEAPSSALTITEVAADDISDTLAELSADAKSKPAWIGYPVRPGYLADLDGDGVCELYANLCFGSGIVDERVQCYDPATDQTSILSDRAVTDYRIKAYKNALYIIARPYCGGNATVCRAVLENGKLACADVAAELQQAVLDAQD